MLRTERLINIRIFETLSRNGINIYYGNGIYKYNKYDSEQQNEEDDKEDDKEDRHKRGIFK